MDTPELWLLLTCALLIAIAAVTLVVEQLQHDLARSISIEAHSATLNDLAGEQP